MNAAALLDERVADPGDTSPVPEYARELVGSVVGHWATVNEALSTYTQGWPVDRMPAVDRALLRVATAEILYHEDVPDAVAISEAVNLATELSTDDSPAFVNGLLARIAALKDTLV